VFVIGDVNRLLSKLFFLINGIEKGFCPLKKTMFASDHKIRGACMIIYQKWIISSSYNYNYGVNLPPQ
jgi:hypothetical protein